MSDPEGCCLTCTYWEATPTPTGLGPAAPGEAEGRCRRLPPVPDPQSTVEPGGLVDPLYVRTSGLDWCGEWRHRRDLSRAAWAGEAPVQAAETATGDTEPALGEPDGQREPSPILDETSYARLRRLYTVEQLRALVLPAEEQDDAALRELARLEDIYRQHRGDR